MSKVQLEFVGENIAHIQLSNEEERILKLNPERMNSLRQALLSIREQGVRGLIISGPHADMFCAGADINLIKEINDSAIAEKMAREGQEIFELIASLNCTTVAAISGPCVGGGCEMALACDYRLISNEESSSIGLPEVRLGIIPAFGGTQRLARLIGLPAALDIILGGKILKAKRAQAVGLVDEILPFETLLGKAQKIAEGSVKPRQKSISIFDRLLTFTQLGRNMVKKKALAKIKKLTKGFYPAPPAALETTLIGLEEGLSKGLIQETKELGKLLVSPESKALVSLFFMSEAAKAIGRSAQAKVDHMQAVVLGAGTMGAGISGILAKHKCQVILKDESEENLSKGLKHIKKYLDGLKYLKKPDKSFILNRIEATTKDSANTGNANLAIEAVYEDIELKKKVLGDLANLTPEDTILASNTSSLSISEIAESLNRPERIVGMHFFNPVEKMPLVEIVRGKHTSDKTIAIIASLTNKLGKFPVVVKDSPGFLVNRILAPYINEALYLLKDGYKIEDIDAAATKFGMPMGPLCLLDTVGLDVAKNVSEVMKNGYGERMQGPEYVSALVDSGRKGKKSGSGFYSYLDENMLPSAEVYSILQIKADKSISDEKQIRERLIMSLINEAVLCLDEGIAGQPSTEAACQVDLGTVMGIGFPAFRGGALYYAESVGLNNVYASLQELEQKYGARFAPVKGVQWRAERNKSFYT